MRGRIRKTAPRTRVQNPDRHGRRRVAFGGYLIGWIVEYNVYGFRYYFKHFKDSHHQLPPLLKRFGLIRGDGVEKVRARVEEIIQHRLISYRLPAKNCAY